jgi:hypothetical protein
MHEELHWETTAPNVLLTSGSAQVEFTKATQFNPNMKPFKAQDIVTKLKAVSAFIHSHLASRQWLICKMLISSVLGCE